MLQIPKPYVISPKIMFMSTALLSCLAVADGNDQHGNADSFEAVPQEYQDVYLTMDKDSNWETEYCISKKQGTLKYHVEAPYETKFGTHSHDESGTHVQVHDLLTREYSTTVILESDGGNFCFTWAKTQNYAEDWPFQLRYWVSD